MLPSPSFLTRPAPLKVPERQTASGRLRLRYDDITQDGRFVVNALPPLLSEVVWGRFLSMEENLGLLRQGIVPILTRLLVTTSEGPFSPNNDLEGTGGYQYAHSVDASGAVDRLYVNMWAEGRAPHAMTYAPPVAKDAPRAAAGSVYAEHVLTRLFSDAGNRKVTELSSPDLPRVPETRIDVSRPEELLSLPAGAIAIGAESSAETFSFGLFQTDSNRHVNSLVYPRLFEQAALTHFARIGRSALCLASWADLRFRKPCFAGDRGIVTVQAFEREGKLGIAGRLTTPGNSGGPHCTAQMIFA